MQLTVNDEIRQAEEGSTVMDLVESVGLDPDATVVERNGMIVERELYDHTPLAEGDVLELVRFVGGG